MAVINNKYRIVGDLEGFDPASSAYIVRDMMDQNKEKAIRIVDGDLLGDALTKYYSDEFSIYRRLASAFIMRDYELEPVKNIGGKNIGTTTNTQYAVLSEYIRNADTLGNIAGKIPRQKVLDVFVQACNAVYYLHTKNIVYGSIDSDNIIIVNEGDGDGLSLKLRDFAAVTLLKKRSADSAYFKSPAHSDSDKSRRVDIYALGVVLFYLVTGGKIGTNFKEDLAAYATANNDDFFAKVMPIIEKATADGGNGYENVLEIIAAINAAFGADYKAFDLSELEQLTFGARLVGREAEIKGIVDNFFNLAAKTSEKRYVYISGEQGIGKTAMITRLKDRFYLQNQRVLWTFDCHGDNALRAVLRQLLDEGGYAPEEADFVRYITSVANGSISLTENSDHGFGRNSLIKFIYDRIKDKTTVIILDDFEFADDFTIDLFEKLAVVCKRLNLVFSTRPVFDSEKMAAFLAKLNESDVLISIELAMLTKDETATFVKNVLSISSVSDEFVELIYKITAGSPLFIEEILKNLQLKRVIYARESDGHWHIDTKPTDYGKLAMPTNVQQAVQQLADTLDKSDYAIVEAISIFHNVLPTQEVLQSINAKCIEPYLALMVTQGILSVAGTGRSAVYNISNKMLRSYALNHLSADRAKQLHIAAADVLLGTQSHSTTILEEVVYHLEAAGEHGRAAEWHQKVGDDYLSLDNTAKAAASYEKALHGWTLLNDKARQVSVLLKHANIMTAMAKMTEAKADILRAIGLSHEQGDTAMHAKALNALFSAEMTMKDRDDALKTKAKIDPFFADEGFKAANMSLYMDFLLSDINFEGLANYAADVTKEKIDYALDVCPEDMPDRRAFVLLRLGQHYNAKGDYAKNAEVLRECIDFFRAAKNPRYTRITMINLAINYANTYQGKIADEIFRELLGNYIEPVNSPIVLMTKAANDYVAFFDVQQAVETFDRAIEAGRLVQTDIRAFGGAHIHAYILAEANMFGKGFEIVELVTDIFEKSGLADVNTISGHLNVATFYVTAGDITKADFHAQKALELLGDSEILRNETNAVADYVKVIGILASKDTSAEKMDVVDRHVRHILNPETIRLEQLGELFFVLNTAAGYSYADVFERYIDEALECANNFGSTSPHLRLKLLRADSTRLNGDKKIAALNAAYQLASNLKLPLMLAQIAMDISAFYADINMYTSRDYAARACEAVRSLLSDTPRVLWRELVSFYGLHTPFAGIVSDFDDSLTDSEGLLDKMMAEDLFDNMLSDNDFRAGVRRDFFANLPFGISGPYDLLRNLCENAEDNLRLFAEYFAAVTCTTRCVITAYDGEENLIAITSNDGRLEPDFIDCKDLIQRAGSNQPVIAKSAFCMPVSIGGGVIGYVYGFSDSVFHNVSADSIKECMEITAPLGMNISMYMAKVDSMLDKLTGCLNRKYLDIALDSLLRQSKETAANLSIIMIDLDKFKDINDTYGHQTGDIVIKAVGKILRANVRKDTPVGRYGGEEFMVVLDNCNADDAKKVAEKLRIAISDAKILGTKRSVTASLGVATFFDSGTTKENLIEKADKALYASKSHGRNKTTSYGDVLDAPVNAANTAKDIMSGDTLIDAMRMRMTLEVIDITKAAEAYKDKADKILGLVKKIADADEVFYIPASEIKAAPMAYSDIMGKAVADKIPHTQQNDGQGYSVAAVPHIDANAEVGVLYLRAPVDRRIYSDDDMGLLNDLGGLMYAVSG